MMGKMAIKGLALSALLGIAFVFNGCDSGGSSTGGTNATTKPSGSGSTKMAGIIFQEDQFFRLIQFGMQDAAKANGIDLVVGNSDNKADKEAQLVQTYVDQGVAAILISPLSAKSSGSALKQAHDKGVVIVTNNTSLEADFPDGDVECSNENLGEQTGMAARKYIEDKLGGKANVAILAFKSQVAEQSDARTGGFKKALAALPNVKIIAEQDAWLTDKAQETAQAIITAHPELDVIFGANEGGTTGSVLAVKQAGKAGKVAVFGTDVSQQLITFLKSSDNILQAITAQKPYEMGQKSLEIALKAIHKETYDKKVVLNGVCLTRTAPDDIASFEKQLQTWTAAGK